MNVVAIPMLLHYLRGKERSVAQVGKVCLVMLPYALVGLGIMAYNYVRFGSPTDFGAAYQLTLVNVADFVKDSKRMGVVPIVNGLRSTFVSSSSAEEFPFVTWGGVFANYPILLYCLYLLQGRAMRVVRDKGLLGIVGTLFALPVVLAIVTNLWSPLYYERYNMDLYPSIVLLLLLAFAVSFEPEADRIQAHAFWLNLALVGTLCKCVLLFCVPYDFSWAEEVPARLKTVWNALTIGHLLG